VTASLFTFIATDGSVVEINSDRINYLKPYIYSLPTGVGIGTTINVGGIDVTVQNSLTGINSVIPSTVVPQTLPSGIIPTYPVVMGSSQTDPFRLIDRRTYELWTRENSPDGMSARVFFSSVVILPPWLGGSDASNGNFGWGRSTDLPPSAPKPIEQTWIQDLTYLRGQDVLPFRNFDINMNISTQFMDTGNYNHVSLGVPS
jgi:hypothetical protein